MPFDLLGRRLLERFRLLDDPVNARIQRDPVVDLLLQVRK